MSGILLEGRLMSDDLNRLYKVYGRRASGYIGDCSRERFVSFVNRVLRNFGYDVSASSESPVGLEFIVRNLFSAEEVFGKMVCGSPSGLRGMLLCYADLRDRGLLSRFGLSSDLNSYSLGGFVSSMSSLPSDVRLYMSSGYRALSGLSGVRVLHESPKYYAIGVGNYNSERVLGSNTNWCTVAGYNSFLHYGGYYVILFPKDAFGGPDLDSPYRYQCHYSNEELTFMDAKDYHRDLSVLNDSDMESYIESLRDDFDELRDSYADESYMSEMLKLRSEIDAFLRQSPYSDYFSYTLSNGRNGEIEIVLSNALCCDINLLCDIEGYFYYKAHNSDRWYSFPLDLSMQQTFKYMLGLLKTIGRIKDEIPEACVLEKFNSFMDESGYIEYVIGSWTLWIEDCGEFDLFDGGEHPRLSGCIGDASDMRELSEFFRVFC